MLITTSLLARITVPTLLALKISCGAGEDDNLTTLGTTTATTSGTASDTTAETTPTTTTLDPVTGTEVGSTEPATTATGSTGDSPSTSGSSDGGESTSGGLPDGACQSDADCDDQQFESCFSGDDVNCGPCQSDAMECLQDRDCGEGLCELVPIDCGCDGPVSHVCAPKCTGDADCQDGKVCELDSGRCEPVSCTAGFVCPEHFDCVPDAGGDDCVRHPCESDAECPQGVCVEGGCFADYGVCMPPGV